MKIIAITPNRKYDLLAHTVIEGLQKLNVEIIATDPMDRVKLNVFSDGEVLEHSKDADYIFAIWGKSMGKFYLLDKINMPEKTVYIDGSEWTYTGNPNPKPGQAVEAKQDYSRRRGEPWINKEILEKAKWYFKRECYQQDIDEFGCIPLPFAIVDEYYVKSQPKTIDLFCAFGQTDTGLRESVEKACIFLNLNNGGYKNIVGSNFSRNTYLDYMATSLISVDALGGGDCNARRWEILANKSCLFSEKWNIVCPHDFTDGLNIVNYKNMIEFEEKIRYYLYHKDKALKIGEQGYLHAQKYHTSEKRVQYLFDILEKTS